MSPEPAAAVGSLERVRRAALAADLPFEPVIMAQSTRTAADAASAIGCTIDQIVKSLIFENKADGSLVLMLVSGSRNVDLAYVSERYGLNLKRADIDRVRRETGFAIGGVAPIGHVAALSTWIDETLLASPVVHAAAGRPDAVFAAEPHALMRAANARPISVNGIVP
jgi:prolyl-tRNA editing enzyme YbaK/EbsC (Cys-tRNA(Pro) deacylase)